MNFGCRKLQRVISAAALLGFAVQGTSHAQMLRYRVFTDPHPPMTFGTVGFTYAGDRFIGTVQGVGDVGKGLMYQCNLDGSNVRAFAPDVELPSSSPIDNEHAVTARLTGLPGTGWNTGNIFVGGGTGVVQIKADGSGVVTRPDGSPWLSGLSGIARAVRFDTTGGFGGDMIVTTNTGFVYRVGPSGVPRLLANTGLNDIEGLDFVPDGAFGDKFKGQLIVSSETDGLIRAIDSTGKITVLNGGPGEAIGFAESANFVPMNIDQVVNPLNGFYSVNYPDNVLHVTQDQWSRYKGDLIVVTEFDGEAWRMHYNTSTSKFEYTMIGRQGPDAEDAFFISNVPEPGMLSFIAVTGLSGLGLAIRRRRR